jgi:hypothetical protein
MGYWLDRERKYQARMAEVAAWRRQKARQRLEKDGYLPDALAISLQQQLDAMVAAKAMERLFRDLNRPYRQPVNVPPPCEYQPMWGGDPFLEGLAKAAGPPKTMPYQAPLWSGDGTGVLVRD